MFAGFFFIQGLLKRCQLYSIELLLVALYLRMTQELLFTQRNNKNKVDWTYHFTHAYHYFLAHAHSKGIQREEERISKASFRLCHTSALCLDSTHQTLVTQF